MSDTAVMPAMEAGIREITAAVGRLELVLARLDERMHAANERMNTTATRKDLVRLEGSLRAELATKPSRGSMWAMAIALVGLVVASIGVGAAYLPLLSRVLHQ
jgi:hypothetical protein